MNFDATVLFTMPTRIYYGYNSASKTGAEARKLRIAKALVVTDAGILRAGVTDPVLQSLEAAGIAYELFADVPMDPNTQVVTAGVELLRHTGCDGIVIVGGGSPLCAGKAIAILAANGGSLRDYEGVEQYSSPPLPVIALPTTAGSGSEVSASLVITDESRNDYKMTINGYDCHPTVAILDPLLLRTLPPGLAAISEADALSHAIEAIGTNLATPLTDAVAYEAIRMMFASAAPAAFADDLAAKRDQLFASTMANIACGNAKLGLVHAMSQPLGSFHVAHGLANAILLPYVMAFNLPACEVKYARLAEVVGAAGASMSVPQKAWAAVEAVKELLQKLGMPDRLPEDLVPRSAIPEMAKIAMGRSHIRTNLRQATEADLMAIYERAYSGWRAAPV